MRRRILKVGSTTVYFHLATCFFMIYMVWLGKGLFLLVSMTSILLHESAHAMAAAVCGKPPEEVEITPLGALMRMDEEEGMSAWKRLCILVAGPLASLGICWLAIAMTKNDVFSSDVGRMIFVSNMVIVMLNLLPALPLDGGRLFALVLGVWCQPHTVRRVLNVSGTIIGFVLIGADLVLCWLSGSWNYSLCMVGCFLMYAAAQGTKTRAMTELRRLMDRKIKLEQKGVLRGKIIAVTRQTPVRLAVEQLWQERYTLFCLLETGTMKLLATVGEEQMISVYLDKPWALCGEVIDRG